MIIRKPYAFFIKNFRKIHILLIIASIIILFKQSKVSSFTKEFIDLKTYDPNNFPITKYIPVYLLLLIILVLAGSIAITIVLQRKNKPWKLYLVPCVTYGIALIIDFIVRTYFLGYNGSETTTEVSLYRDVLIFTNLTQYISIGIFLLRVSGLDLRKFNFQLDEEYLELDEEDQEEIEININIDKYSFVRTANKLIRNLKYFYQEHKKICIAVIVIISIFLIREAYTFIFISNKSYKQNDAYNVDGYTFVVKNAYYTDKSDNGEVISNADAFVIIELNVTNNFEESRILNLDHFHILNGISNYAQKDNTYAAEFEDLGETYNKKELLTGKSHNMIVIYKVAKDLNKNRFVLCYQESEGKAVLRKIKLKMTDLSSIKEHSLELEDGMKIKLNNLEDQISIDSIRITSKAKYIQRLCTMEECENVITENSAPAGKKMLKIDYGTDELESKELIDFSTKYGKIIYIDNNKKQHTINMEYALEDTVKGKTFYALIPADVDDTAEITLNYTIRNNSYNYKIKV